MFECCMRECIECWTQYRFFDNAVFFFMGYNNNNCELHIISNNNNNNNCMHIIQVQEQLNALWDHPPDACNLDWLGLPPNTPPLPPHCRAFPLYGNRAVENAERGHAVENVRGNGEGMVSSTGKVQDLPDQPQLCTKHPILLGAAVSVAHKQRPVYVSVGHRVSLATAVRLVVACCRYRIPEPIRQADILSRAMLMSSTHNLRPQRIAGDE